jgi:hypothetical protein
MRRTILALAAASMLGACMSQENMSVVEAAAQQFFQLQQAGQDAEIFGDASPGFRDAAQLSDLERINGAVRAARGCSAPVRDAANWRSNQSTSGHFVTVVYRRQCEGGELVDTLVFRIVGDQALLNGYNASGMALFPATQPTAAPTSAVDTPAPSQQPAP